MLALRFFPGNRTAGGNAEPSAHMQCSVVTLVLVPVTFMGRLVVELARIFFDVISDV